MRRLLAIIALAAMCSPVGAQLPSRKSNAQLQLKFVPAGESATVPTLGIVKTKYALDSHRTGAAICAIVEDPGIPCRPLPGLELDTWAQHLPRVIGGGGNTIKSIRVVIPPKGQAKVIVEAVRLVDPYADAPGDPELHPARSMVWPTVEVRVPGGPFREFAAQYPDAEGAAVVLKLRTKVECPDSSPGRGRGCAALLVRADEGTVTVQGGGR